MSKKDSIEIETNKKTKEARYNEWVENYAELKKNYEEEVNKRKMESKKLH